MVRTENHPDNAAASVFGGLRVGGRGPAGDWYSWPGVLSGWGVRLLLVIPRIPIATDQARSLLPTSYSRSASVQNLQCLAVLLSGLARGDWEAVRRGLRDHLHEPYRLPLVPGLKEALTALREHPSTGGAYLSGAGPTRAAFRPDPAAGPQTAGEALRILKDLGTDAEVQIAALEERGIRVET
ncbi:MAG: hypothetical protein ACE5GW_00275 [Planctomycetota bacterium]